MWRGIVLGLCIVLAGCLQGASPADPSTPPPDEPPAPSSNAPASTTSAPPPANASSPSDDDNATVTPGPDEERPPPRDTGMIFDVASDVPDHDLELIQYAFAMIGDYLASDLGGDIPAERRAQVTVKVVATGEGDPSPAAAGSCCTAYAFEADGDMRPFFDVKHPQWLNKWAGWPADVQRERTVAHEYVHGWQNTLGCATIYDQPLGNWVNEGLAEQVAFAPLFDRGDHTKEEVLAFMEQSAKAGDGAQWNTPLALQEDTNSGIWSGHIGYLALDLALDGHADLMPLKTICQEAAAGADLDEAFETAFEKNLNQFYAEFEAWKAARP